MSTGEPATSAEAPWPVRTVARKIAAWVGPARRRLGRGPARPGHRAAGTGAAFLVLRDPAADVSLQLTAPIGLVARRAARRSPEGNRVVVHGKPSFFLGRGTLGACASSAIRAVGIGELLARIERLRALLAAEGLFDAARKRRLPFLPACIGLITGRASGRRARRGVSNATARWPAVRFRLEHAAVQGGAGRAPDRRGRSVSWTGEPAGRRHRARPRRWQRRGPAALLRRDAVPRRRRVPGPRSSSAIGHEPDTPLVDHVADLRCSTPTEAGRRLVPDLRKETARVAGLRDRARRALAGWVDREERLAHRTAPPGRCWQTRCAAWRARHTDVARLREAARGRASRAAWTAGPPTSGTSRPA